ncbi:Alpha/Beta hydrolase protein [Chlamydoabsidia padenii]|nr:Alpha/Beta hydrolase protein [Chlamydoabsidia padenii]
MIESFEIPRFTETQLSDLHYRLDHTIYPQELNAPVGWKYGTPRRALQPLAQEWRHQYDWEQARDEMNQWHHFKLTTNDGMKIHFIHESSSQPNAIPLLLLHGWPSTFYEFHKVINPLRDGAHNGQAYHVVTPSLPGYGFSDPPTTPGFGIAQMGDSIHQIMEALGYSKYIAHGTDWGSMVVRYLVSRYHQQCLAIHCTLFVCTPPMPTLKNLYHHPLKVAKFLLGATVLGFDQVYGPGKLKIKGRNFADVVNDREAGYRAIQGTRPYSLSYGLSDSPVGLLGWMLEKYHNWTYHSNKDKFQSIASLPSTVSSKEFLTQVSIYWLTNTMSSSMRLYYEVFHQLDELTPAVYINNPVAVSLFEDEVLRVPKEWIEATANLVLFQEHPMGGHFSAMEEGSLLVSDLQLFGGKMAHLFK